MKKRKIRISYVSSFRITDCSPELIAKIDDICAQEKISRVDVIRKLSGNPIEQKSDVRRLQQWVKSQGYKNVERWLKDVLIGGDKDGK